MKNRTHMERVLDLAAAVTARRTSGRGYASLKKASVSHFVPNPRDPRHDDQKIDVRELRNILSIDPEARRCVAEPGVTFSDLVTATLPHGLVPRLVPELETITIGGAVAGCAVESTAYKWGGFHDGCVEYEMVTGEGDVIRCSREHDAELFEMMHGSYGTLGILTELTFDLVPAKPFVKMEYATFDSFPALHAAIDVAIRAPTFDFVDAIAHARDRFVLCTGRYVDEAPQTSSYRREHVYWESTRELAEDWLTTYDYFFRFDTDCHWTAQTLPGMKRAWSRKLLGSFMLGSSNLLAWSERLRPLFRLQKHPPVVTDLFIPESGADAFHRWYDGAISHYPMWIVPYRMPTPYPWLRAPRPGLYFDFAIYGLPNDRDDVDYSLLLEQKTFEAGGIKTLIAQNHYDERTFFSIHDRSRYERIKRRVDPENLFRTVYEKMVAPHLRYDAAPCPPSTIPSSAR